MIFRRDRKILWTLRPTSMTYTEIAQKDLEDLRKLVAGLKALKYVEAKDLPQISFRKGATARVGEWSCDRWDIIVDNVKEDDLCVVKPETLGMSAGEAAVAQEFINFLIEVADAIGIMAPAARTTRLGYPIQEVKTPKGGLAETAKIAKVERQSFPASYFELPSGYRRVEFHDK